MHAHGGMTTPLDSSKGLFGMCVFVSVWFWLHLLQEEVPRPGTAPALLLGPAPEPQAGRTRNPRQHKGPRVTPD